MIFDLRKDEEKQIQRNHGHIRCLRLQTEIWENRPSLIWSESVENQKSTWAQSIYWLEKQNQILYISIKNEDEENAYTEERKASS